MKIQIKSILGKILFETDKSSVKDAVVKAVKANPDLGAHILSVQMVKK